jgi:phage tail sheath protein FI
MVVATSYPGVYIDEVPSGNFTITPVATSITAFVGRTLRGPVGDPTECFSFGDFENDFGGLAYDYPLSYAVWDFFTNGGGEAIIVRVQPAAPPAASQPPGGATENAAPATPAFAPALLAYGGFAFEAADGGAWGNALTLTIGTPALTDEIASHRYGAASAANCFSLTLAYTKPDKSLVTEVYPVVTIDNTPYRLDRLLQQQSSLAILNGWPATPSRPADATAQPFSGGADGGNLSDSDLIGDQAERTGLYALEHCDLFNLLCIPWDARSVDIDSTVHAAASTYCSQRRAMYIIDGPSSWTDLAKKGAFDKILPTDLGITTQDTQRNSIVYFPKIQKIDTLMGGLTDTFPACGVIAGQIAQTDATRGVWKAPAGVATGLGGITGLEFNLTDAQQGQLNPIGINCLRNFKVLGPLVWGARTLRGADIMSDDYKYVPVRRLTLFIEESLYRGTQFAVFEPNNETLWSQIRLTVDAFMSELSRQGAFYNYKITCDGTINTQDYIDRGICNILVQFAPVKPAEFIVVMIQQTTASSAS